MPHHHDVERSLEQLREQALVEAVQGGPAEVSRMEALKELARRRSPRAGGVLSSVLLDNALPADLRAVAAVEAGKQVLPASERALVAALQSGPSLVVRRAAESLGRVGGREALEALRATRSYKQEPAVARAVSFARSLISYRLSVGTDLLETPGAAEVLKLDDPEPAAVQVEPVSADVVERMTPRFRLEVPGVAVSLRGALQLRCGANEFLLMPQQALSDLGRRNAVVGVVLKRAQSLEYFALHLYLLSHPRDERTLALFGVRPDGTVTHFGEILLGAPEHAFRLNALNTPYGPPVDIQGHIDVATHRIVLAQAVVNRRLSRAQRRAQVPTKIKIGR
jgi:hypothetical protein